MPPDQAAAAAGKRCRGWAPPRTRSTATAPAGAPVRTARTQSHCLPHTGLRRSSSRSDRQADAWRCQRADRAARRNSSQGWKWQSLPRSTACPKNPFSGQLQVPKSHMRFPCGLHGQTGRETAVPWRMYHCSSSKLQNTRLRQYVRGRLTKPSAAPESRDGEGQHQHRR